MWPSNRMHIFLDSTLTENLPDPPVIRLKLLAAHLIRRPYVKLRRRM